LEERRLGLAELVARYWRRGGWAWLNWWLDIGGEEAGPGSEQVAGYWRRGGWALLNWWLDTGEEEAGPG
jgi:hypothetical protein